MQRTATFFTSEAKKNRQWSQNKQYERNVKSKISPKQMLYYFPVRNFQWKWEFAEVIGALKSTIWDRIRKTRSYIPTMR